MWVNKEPNWEFWKHEYPAVQPQPFIVEHVNIHMVLLGFVYVGVIGSYWWINLVVIYP